MLLRASPDQRTPLMLFWLFSLAGLWYTLQRGQIYMPLVLATVGAWLLMKKGQSIKAGILIGIIVATKPTFAVWPLALLVSGHLAIAASAMVIATLLSALPLLFFGTSVYLQWLAMLPAGLGVVWPTNASLPALLGRVSLPGLTMPFELLLSLLLVAFVWRTRPSALKVSELALIVSLLAHA